MNPIIILVLIVLAISISAYLLKVIFGKEKKPVDQFGKRSIYWDDLLIITKKMSEVQRQSIQFLSDSDNNNFMLRVSLIDLQKTIKGILDETKEDKP